MMLVGFGSTTRKRKCGEIRTPWSANRIDSSKRSPRARPPEEERLVTIDVVVPDRAPEGARHEGREDLARGLLGRRVVLGFGDQEPRARPGIPCAVVQG